MAGIPVRIQYFMRRFYWLLLLIATPCCAQLSKVNELQLKLKQTNPDTTRLHLLQQLSDAYTLVDPIQKLHYAKECKALAEKLHNDKALADAYISIGISYGIRSKLDTALYYFSLAYSQSQKINYPLGMGKSMSDMGFAYDRMDDKKDAIKCYFQALSFLKKTSFKHGILQCYTNIGSLYFDLKQFKIAETYFAECLKNATENKNEADIGYALYTLGNCYQALDENDKALDYLNKSLAIRDKLGDVNGSGLARRALGITYLHKKQYDLALSNLQIALTKIHSLKDKYEESAVLASMADVYLAMNDDDNAIACATQALNLGKAIHSKIASIDALEKLAPAYKNKHQLDKAYKYQSEYIDMQDSILKEKALKDVTLTEFNRIRSENAILSKDNDLIASKNNDYLTRLNKYSNVIVVTLSILGMVMLMLFVMYRRNREKQATNKLLLQQKEEIATINRELETLNEELNSQMELTGAQNTELEKLNEVKNKFFSIISHDLRGPLATIQSLFSIYRDGTIGEDELNMLLGKLEDTILSTSAFLDNLLEWSKSQLEGIVINPENFNISNHIAQNIHLFATQISFKKLNVINMAIRPIMVYADGNMINLVIRNLLSNSIKFCDAGDKIILSAQTKGDVVLISIQDTGPGISEADSEKLFKLEHTFSTGTQGEKGNYLGLILCRDMVIQNKGKIWFDTKPGEGTTFWIELPVGMV